MRHFEDYEIEHLLNSTGSIFLRLFCRWHLKKCTICRSRMENLLEDRFFMQHLRAGVHRLKLEGKNGSFVENDSSGEIK